MTQILFQAVTELYVFLAHRSSSESDEDDDIRQLEYCTHLLGTLSTAEKQQHAAFLIAYANNQPPERQEIVADLVDHLTGGD